ARPAAQRKTDKHGSVSDELVPFMHFHLDEADGTARAPGHSIVATVNEAAVVTLLQEGPDGVVVLLRHGKVTAPLIRGLAPILVAVPVHPIAQTDRLLGLDAGELVNPVLTLLHKPIDAGERIARHEVFDVALGAQLEFLLNFDFDPQTLAVKAILVAQFMPRHSEIALVSILVSPTPGMMYAHGVVGGDRAIEKGPAWFTTILFAEFVEDFVTLPEIEDGTFLGGE